ncbi:MAG: type II toxin-antitoxin system PemK/MazF family toxin [Deltaproteobacteria bacterium]|nr:type II toxin-antitoxin system PemK/MazF family toxin [Deltaproteobacteria bacterium]
MIQEGQIVLFRFPFADRKEVKLRPALVIRQLPGTHGDWLICMITSQLSQEIISFDETISEEDSDFSNSGLKFDSVIRIGRLAVVNKTILEGAIGEISSERLNRIKNRLSDWLIGK